jgi:hypothetical protein
MGKVRVVGQGNNLFASDDKQIVNIGSKYYLKGSDNLTVVKNRYYRKESPLIIKCFDGSYVLRKDAVYNRGLTLNPFSSNSVNIRGEWLPKEFTVEVDGVTYFKDDVKLCTCTMSKTLIIADEAIRLTSLYLNYTSGFLGRTLKETDLFVHKKYLLESDKEGILVKTLDKDYAFKKDCLPVLTDNVETLYHLSNSSLKGYTCAYIAVGMHFINGKLMGAESAWVLDTMLFSISIAGRSVYIYKPHEKLFIDASSASIVVADINVPFKLKKEAIKSICAEEDENQNASSISSNYAPTPGGTVFYDPAIPFKISPKSDKTGGIKYTYGVELETSAGQLTDAACKAVNVVKVGDRSIGAYEYVTPPLHANEGLLSLQKACDKLSKHTMVDNRCGVHVHVGGWNVVGGGKSFMESPSFSSGDIASSIKFSIRAIQLGCSIENDLFNMLPPTRLPNNKYCYSIKGYAGISRDNYDALLGAFVFGEAEETMSQQHRLFNYSLKNGLANARQTKWQHARYKWLNLVNLFTPRPTTAEIRVFPGTLSYDKVEMFVLISLSFVKYVESYGSLLDAGERPSLVEMLTRVYKNDAVLLAKVLEFVDSRTKLYSPKRKLIL